MTLLLVAALAGCAGVHSPSANLSQSLAGNSMNAGKALYEQKCRTEAGAKIYRRIEGVEGIVLLKVRPKAWEPEWSDPLWPGAAFALEAKGDEYIETFLGYEYAATQADGQSGAITKEKRGYIAMDRRPGGRPGYQFVDVAGDAQGQRYRYRLTQVPRATSRIGAIDSVLVRSLTLEPSPRYGVTFDDAIQPNERALGVARSTVKAIDLQNGEILGELTRFAWVANADWGGSTMWLNARKCPAHAVGSDAATRKFVDQILIPKAED